MLKAQLARVCSNHTWFVGRALIFALRATFPGFFNPGYNRKLDKRARVLLSGQTISEESLTCQLNLTA